MRIAVVESRRIAIGAKPGSAWCAGQLLDGLVEFRRADTGTGRIADSRGRLMLRPGEEFALGAGQVLIVCEQDRLVLLGQGLVALVVGWWCP